MASTSVCFMIFWVIIIDFITYGSETTVSSTSPSTSNKDTTTGNENKHFGLGAEVIIAAIVGTLIVCAGVVAIAFFGRRYYRALNALKATNKLNTTIDCTNQLYNVAMQTVEPARPGAPVPPNHGV
ncbi:hypothetical protein ElyMa_001120200 [Elysia marginata]|uniref:Uncharacterized protein n=1 Tax=Elysia marginata TaxID=1093978 RepID=A0AAV4I059_9GAST|nr:hypothetical protein ElyMa_001120200 [Elysia marginata]